MLILDYASNNIDREALAAIERGESFDIRVGGRGARLVKKALPVYEYYWGTQRKSLNRFERLRLGVYVCLTSIIGQTYFFAHRAGMTVNCSEHSGFLILSFRKTLRTDTM